VKRAPIVISATVVGTGAVLGFHAHHAATPLAAAAATSTSSGSSPSSGSSASSSSSRSSTTATKTATGLAEQTRYGPAQVRVTVLNGKIAKIEAVQLQNSDAKSQAISSYAAPILQQAVLSKQTAAVGAVSGATYSSLSYEASLQSALDKVSYKAPDGTAASTDVTQLQ
jgi:uncharacterized protein with FMN-binding domain